MGTSGRVHAQGDHCLKARFLCRTRWLPVEIAAPIGRFRSTFDDEIPWRVHFDGAGREQCRRFIDICESQHRRPRSLREERDAMGVDSILSVLRGQE